MIFGNAANFTNPDEAAAGFDFLVSCGRDKVESRIFARPGAVDRAACHQAADDAIARGAHLLVLDDERPQLDMRWPNARETERAIADQAEALRHVTTRAPGLRVALYGVPQRTLWMHASPETLAAYQAHAARFGRGRDGAGRYDWQGPLDIATDVCLSCYVHGPERPQDIPVLYQPMLDVAKRFGKPIVPFVCPVYVDRNWAGGRHYEQPVSLGEWAALLDLFAANGIDRVAWWDGRPVAYDPADPLVREVQRRRGAAA